jgi:arylformamidase
MPTGPWPERRLIDITPLVDSRLAVWPGDTPLTREVLLDMARGDNLTLSTLRATVHLGAHADAPSHYGAASPSIEAADLDVYLGRCQVVETATWPGGTVGPDDIPAPITAERLLIRTGTFPDRVEFRRDFARLSVELMDWIADRGVRLVGVDTPSVDAFDSKDLPVHRAALRRNIALLECLDLAAVPEGTYELIALPLKLAGFDASPVRAVLRTLE